MEKDPRAPLVLGSTFKEKAITLAYDFYMFLQLLLFYFFSLTIGGACYLFGGDQLLNRFISLIEKIGGMTQKQ
jgi:hypothetical protein